MIDPSEFEAFRRRQHGRWFVALWAITGVAVASFFLLGLLGSYLMGLVAVALVAAVGYEGLRRWNRRQWLRRFPELVDRDFKWRPDRARRVL